MCPVIDHEMTKFMLNNKTDAGKPDINLLDVHDWKHLSIGSTTTGYKQCIQYAPGP